MNQIKRPSKSLNSDRPVEYFSNYFIYLHRYKPRFPDDIAAKHAAIGKEYNKQTTILNNKRDKDLQTKIYLMQEAMECVKNLPSTNKTGLNELYTKALIIDRNPPPVDRPFPMWDTPPIKDFDVKEYLKKEAAESVGQESSDLV